MRPKIEWWRPGYAGGFFGENYIIGDEWYDSLLRGRWMSRAYRAKREAEAVREVACSICSIKEEELVLDCPCGYGRLLPWFTAYGMKVVAIDININYLTRAKQKNDSSRVNLISCDMRQLSIASESVSVIANMWTSFGYFEDENDDRRVLHEWARVLKPDGVVIIHTTLNPRRISSMRQVLEKLIPLKYGGVLRVCEHYNTKEDRVFGSWFFEGMSIQSYNKSSYNQYAIRIWSEQKWRHEAETAGFEVINFSGSLDNILGELNETDEEFVVLLRKLVNRTKT